MYDAARVAMAWASIVDDAEGGRLNIDLNQQKQAKKEMETANGVLPKAARECFRWLLCPTQDDPTATTPTLEPLALNTTSGSLPGELERTCRENEWVIEAWSPIHLRAALKAHYWKNGKVAVGAAAFWEDTLKYLFLPRLKTRDVLAAVVRSGSTGKDYFGTADNQVGDKYQGFQFGDAGAALHDTLLLIEPDAAREYAKKTKVIVEVEPPEGPKPDPADAGEKPQKQGSGPTPTAKPKSFHGSVDVPAATAKTRLIQISDEVLTILGLDKDATIRVTVEIEADFPNGASDTIRRGVSENATQLGFKSKEWE